MVDCVERTALRPIDQVMYTGDVHRLDGTGIALNACTSGVNLVRNALGQPHERGFDVDFFFDQGLQFEACGN